MCMVPRDRVSAGTKCVQMTCYDGGCHSPGCVQQQHYLDCFMGYREPMQRAFNMLLLTLLLSVLQDPNMHCSSR